MASTAATARDIPQGPAMVRDNLAVVADKRVPVTTAGHLDLLTPPHSISPTMPALGSRLRNGLKYDLSPIDSDLELDRAHEASAPISPPLLDASGEITGELLARFHLPHMFSDKKPLALREILAQLTATVPGFSGIPYNKARRIVMGAMEGKGSRTGGLNDDIEFVKVSWGRWLARPRGTLPSEDGELHFSHDEEDVTLMRDRACDEMSLDGPASVSGSEETDDDMIDDDDEMTDTEDWAAIGAAALRAEASSSYERETWTYRPRDRLLRPATVSFQDPSHLKVGFATSFTNEPDFFSASAEREACEALLQLGSL